MPDWEHLVRQRLFHFLLRVIVHRPAAIRLAHRLIAVGLLASFASLTAWSASPQRRDEITVSRSANAVLDRLEISPREVTLGASQTQRFKVTNTKGEVIPVHWTVSSPDCSGSACGTIDDKGDYIAPSSLSKALLLVLEGVLVSDPRHSVLTRIQLVPNVGTQASAEVSNGEMRASTVLAALENNSGPVAELLAPGDTDPPALVRSDVSRKPGAVVTFQDGLLTVSAENTSLADVFKLVAQKTGTVIDLPPGSGLEQMVAHAGPGRANDVLAQLLNGSHFNFIFVSSPQHPNQPERVVLSMRPEDTEVAKPVSAPAAELPAYVSKTASVDAAPAPVAPRVDNILTPPKEQMSPEALGDLMKEKARQLREKIQEQTPPQ